MKFKIKKTNQVIDLYPSSKKGPHFWLNEHGEEYCWEELEPVKIKSKKLQTNRNKVGIKVQPTISGKIV